MHNPVKPHSTSGYTLVELSIVIIILSLLTASGLAMGASIVERSAYIDTSKKLDMLHESLRDYYIVNGRLPCVATVIGAPGTADFGTEVGAGGVPCVDEAGGIEGTTRYSVGGGLWIGMIPVRALGLPDKAASDQYGNRILYAVSEDLTSAATFGGASGEITILDMNDNEIVNDAAYAILSNGKDRKGAFSYSDATGTVAIGCGSSDNLDVINCDDSDPQLRDAPYNQGDVEDKFFDDLIRWTPKYHLAATDTQSTSLWASDNVTHHTYSVGIDGNSMATANVGIGTANPQQKLHVVGPARIDSTGDFHLYIRNPNAPDGLRNWALQDASSAGKLMFRSRNEDWSFKQTLLAMDHDTGRVGVFTSTPEERLHVNGNLRVGSRFTINPDLAYGSTPGTTISGETGSSNHLTLYAQNNSNNGASISLAGRTSSFWGNGRITYRASSNQTDHSVMHHFYRISSSGTAKELMEIQANGNTYIYGTDYFKASDKRLKRDFRPIEDALQKLLQIHGTYYRWNERSQNEDKESLHIGVIAQDVQSVFPELVGTQNGGYLSLDYGNLTPIIVEAIRELKAENDALKTQLEARGAPSGTIVATYDPLKDYRLLLLAVFITFTASGMTALLIRRR